MSFSEEPPLDANTSEESTTYLEENFINESSGDAELSYADEPTIIDNPEEMLKPWNINPFFFYIIAIHSVTLVFGLIGNVTVVTVMVRDKRALNATNIFLVSLAVADLLLLVICVPLETVQYFILQWDESGTVCRLAKYAELLSAVASVFNLIAVTLERFIVIVYPIKSRSLCTISNCKKTLVFVWVLSLFLSAPVLFTKTTYKMIFSNNVTHVTLYYCNDFNSHWSVIFVLYQFFILFGAPGSLMIICYTIVISELWKSTKTIQLLTNDFREQNTAPQKSQEPAKELIISSVKDTTVTHLNKSNRKQNKGEDARRSRKQVIKMLILVIALFLICWGPHIVMLILIKFNLHSFTPTFYTLRVVFNLLPFIHACMNPLIYSFMSKNFRKSLKHQMEEIGCVKKKPADYERNRKHNSWFKTFQSRTTTFTESWHGLRLNSGRGSTAPSTTNYVTDTPKLTDTEALENNLALETINRNPSEKEDFVSKHEVSFN